MIDPVEWISVEDIACGALDRPLLGLGGVLEVPIAIVDLDPLVSPAATCAAVERILACDRVVVGHRTRPAPGKITRELARALDTTVSSNLGDGHREFVFVEDPDRELANFVERFHENPYAATIASQVLRLSEHLEIPAALDIESLAYSTLLGTPDFRKWLDVRGPRPLPPKAPQEPVLLERCDELLHITLNRPERRNAYGAQVRDGLVAALEVALMEPSITHILLDGSGKSFSAGGDLDEFGTTPDLAIAHLVRTRAGAGRLVARLADRIEVRVHGSCVGAGIEIPAFASTIVARSDAIFRLPRIGMGLIPGAGGTVSIPRRIGRHRAYHLFVSGETIDAPRALEWGLIDQIFPDSVSEAVSADDGST